MARLTRARSATSVIVTSARSRSRTRASSASGQPSEIAREAGPDFSYRPAWRANTVDAHRLLAAALDHGGPPPGQGWSTPTGTRTTLRCPSTYARTSGTG